jgi:hypothetical protein
MEVGMFGSLGYSQSALVLALVLVPVYLVYRVWHLYSYTKSLEKMLSERNGKSNWNYYAQLARAWLRGRGWLTHPVTPNEGGIHVFGRCRLSRVIVCKIYWERGLRRPEATAKMKAPTVTMAPTSDIAAA